MAKQLVPAWARARMGKILATTFLCVMLALLTVSMIHNVQYIAGPGPQGVSELYFAQPDQLPKQMQVGVDYSAQFTIVNHEGRDMAYSYQVTVIENGIQRSQPPATLIVAKDGTQQQAVHFRAVQTGVSVQVVVQLVGTDQKIHFRAQS